MKTSVGTVTVSVLTVEMTYDEWRRVLGQPAEFLGEVRRQLGELAAGGNGTQKKRAKKGKSPAPRTAAGGAKVECEICHEKFARRGLGVHKRKAHGINGSQVNDAEIADWHTTITIPRSGSTAPGANSTS